MRFSTGLFAAAAAGSAMADPETTTTTTTTTRPFTLVSSASTPVTPTFTLVSSASTVVPPTFTLVSSASTPVQPTFTLVSSASTSVVQPTFTLVSSASTFVQPTFTLVSSVSTSSLVPRSSGAAPSSSSVAISSLAPASSSVGPVTTSTTSSFPFPQPTNGMIIIRMSTAQLGTGASFVTTGSGSVAVQMQPSPYGSSNFGMVVSKDQASSVGINNQVSTRIIINGFIAGKKAKRAETECTFTVTANGNTIYNAPVAPGANPATFNAPYSVTGLNLEFVETCGAVSTTVVVSDLEIGPPSQDVSSTIASGSATASATASASASATGSVFSSSAVSQTSTAAASASSSAVNGNGNINVFIFVNFPGSSCDGEWVFLAESCSCNGGTQYVSHFCSNGSCNGITVYKPQLCSDWQSADVVFVPCSSTGTVSYQPWEASWGTPAQPVVSKVPTCNGAGCPTVVNGGSSSSGSTSTSGGSGGSGSKPSSVVVVGSASKHLASGMAYIAALAAAFL